MFEDISKIVLLSDMDGTLLNSEKKITDKDLEAIERFTRLGGNFTVATGRTVQSFEQYLSALKLKMPVILYNGAAIYDFSEKKTLYSQPLPPECKEMAAKLFELMPESGGEVLRTDGTYVFSNNEYEQIHTTLCNIVPYYTDLDKVEEGGWLKVLFALAPEDIPRMEENIKKLGYDKKVDFVRSAGIFLEMLPFGVNKGSALEQYRKLDGMKDYIFIAAGDFDNDLDMLQAADFGACPSNAEEIVKKSADLVLENSCNNGAIAELIDYIIERSE